MCVLFGARVRVVRDAAATRGRGLIIQLYFTTHIHSFTTARRWLYATGERDYSYRHRGRRVSGGLALLCAAHAAQLRSAGRSVFDVEAHEGVGRRLQDLVLRLAHVEARLNELGDRLRLSRLVGLHRGAQFGLQRHELPLIDSAAE